MSISIVSNDGDLQRVETSTLNVTIMMAENLQQLTINKSPK